MLVKGVRHPFRRFGKRYITQTLRVGNSSHADVVSCLLDGVAQSTRSSCSTADSQGERACGRKPLAISVLSALCLHKARHDISESAWGCKGVTAQVNIKLGFSVLLCGWKDGFMNDSPMISLWKLNYPCSCSCVLLDLQSLRKTIQRTVHLLA